MMSQAITTSIFDRMHAELFSAAMDGLSTTCRQMMTGICLGAVGLSVILSVTVVLIGVTELGLGIAGPAIPPGQIQLP